MRSIAFGMLAAASLLLPGGVAAQPKTVAITAIVEHPALDAVRDGVKQGLAELGYTEGQDVVFTYESAQGNPATATQIARQLVGAAPAVIVAISTPSAQSVVAATKELPVVFSAVTDPVAAQLVASIDEPGGNVTGVSDMAPVGDHVALIREITPDVKRLGVVYNPGEANSVSTMAALKTAAEAAGIELVETTANRSADVQAAVRGLVGKVDAIYVPTDNTIVSALESAVGVANEARLPLYAGDVDSVDRGALAAVGFDYGQVGIKTAGLVDRILKGETPGAIPVEFASGSDLRLNRKAAAAIGLSFPQAVLDRAAKVIE